MQRIDNRTVELTADEMVASDQWDALLDDGYGIAAAVAELRTIWPQLSEDFWEWLS